MRITSLIAAAALGLAVPVALATPSHAAPTTSFTCSGLNFVSSDKMAFASGCSPFFTGHPSNFLLLHSGTVVYCLTGNDIGTSIVGMECTLL